MLVVSRKSNQKVLFPNLGISVEILRIAGNAVRVGVDAPDDVRILRGELADEEESHGSRETDRQQRHDLRNRLNAATLALHLLQKQLDASRFAEAEDTLHTALETLTELDRLATDGDTTMNRRANTNGRRALVVEDNAHERELLAGYLRLCGYEVEAVEDGLAAMMYLRENERPDLVLLDMQMPRMDGMKTVSAIRCQRKYRGIKLFAVSGTDRNSTNVSLGERGVDRWFAKPLKPAEFANEIDTVMRECGVA